MTLTEFQTALHALYRGDGSTPVDASAEWNYREALLGAAISVWDNQGYLWNELWVNLVDAADGDKTIVAATVDYDMPTNFRFLGSFVRTTNSDGGHSYYSVGQPQDAELLKNSSASACYVTGNKATGFDLHFMQQPATGETINYPYYKEPASITAAASVIEMSDPYFALFFCLAKMHEREGAGDRARAAFSMADEKLKQMKVRNLMLPSSQTNKVRDRDYDRGISGFGGGGGGLSRFGAVL